MEFEYATSPPRRRTSNYLLPQNSKRLPSRLLHHLTLRLLNHLCNNLHPTLPPHSPLPLRHLAHTLQAHHPSQLQLLILIPTQPHQKLHPLLLRQERRHGDIPTAQQRRQRATRRAPRRAIIHVRHGKQQVQPVLRARTPVGELLHAVRAAHQVADELRRRTAEQRVCAQEEVVGDDVEGGADDEVLGCCVEGGQVGERKEGFEGVELPD